MYFETDEQGVSQKWVSHIKNTIANIAPHYTMKRMLDDYYEKFYGKLFERSKMIRSDHFKMAEKISNWKKEISAKWDQVEVVSVRLPDSSSSPMSLGDQFNVEIQMNTNHIPAQNIGIDIVIGQNKNDGEKEIFYMEELKLINSSSKKATYSCNVTLKMSGVFDFAFRIFPKAEFLAHRQDFNLVKWV